MSRTSEVACAVAFGITRRSFRETIDQAQNSKKVVEQQLSLAVSVARLDLKLFLFAVIIFVFLCFKKIDYTVVVYGTAILDWFNAFLSSVACCLTRDCKNWVILFGI